MVDKNTFKTIVHSFDTEQVEYSRSTEAANLGIHKNTFL